MQNFMYEFQLARNEIFIRQHGDRRDAPNVAVIITDGESTERQADTIPMAQVLKDAGTRVISVGITSSVNMTELRAIASGQFI